MATRLKNHPRFSEIMAERYRELITKSALCITFGKAGCNKPPPVTVVFGASKSASSALIWLTDKLGFFAEQVMQVELKACHSGKQALAALINKMSIWP